VGSLQYEECGTGPDDKYLLAPGLTPPRSAGSRRVVITDAGHLMYLEKPEEFSRVVITFIDRNGP